MLNRCSSNALPNRSRASLFNSPLLGAASSSQAIAPRNGGVTNDAVTSARITPPYGRSVRATSHPIGAATAQQIKADEVARVKVVISGSINDHSVNSRYKMANVKAPLASVRL